MQAQEGLVGASPLLQALVKHTQVVLHRWGRNDVRQVVPNDVADPTGHLHGARAGRVDPVEWAEKRKNDERIEESYQNLR